MTDNDVTIEVFTAKDLVDHSQELGALLNVCVLAGASVSFVLPHSLPDSIAFWTAKVRPAMEACGRLLLVARKNGRIAGSVQLDCDMPPNQAHRAEVSKLLVHPKFQRQGIARALMVELEHHAKRLGRRLITLDTITGGKAEPLYLSLGYEKAGTIPNFARDPIEDRCDPTTFMFKEI